jgi:hypothetical protein
MLASLLRAEYGLELLWLLLWPGPEQLWGYSRARLEAWQLHCPARSIARSCSAPAPAASERHRNKEIEYLDSTRGGKYIGKRLSSTSSSRAPLNSAAYQLLKYKLKKEYAVSFILFELGGLLPFTIINTRD